METSRNLDPGQYQLGNAIFGHNTLFNVSKFDVGGWDVNVQDYQQQMADELQFGSDSFKPNPIQIEMAARRNVTLENIAAITGFTTELNYENDMTIGQFTREWRADEVRKKWGALKPLYVCRQDGTTVMVFGRPGKMAVGKEVGYVRPIVAEFRRSDTLCYNDFEWYTQLRVGESQTIYRSSKMKQGDAPSWFRLLLVGPMTRPIIQLGPLTIELDYEVELGEVVEINSNPWSNRVVRLNDNISLAAKLVRPYLKEMKFDVDTPYQFSWNATNTNVAIEKRLFSAYANTTDGLPTADWYAPIYSGSTDGKMSVASGELAWQDSGNGARQGISIFKTPSLGVQQTVGFKQPAPGELGIGGPEPTDRIIGRSNQAGTEYLYWDIGFSQSYYGYHKDGIDYQLSPKYDRYNTMTLIQEILGSFFDSLFGHDNNWTYEVDFGTGANELSSTLRINGVPFATYNDNNVLSSFGIPVQNLYGGLGMKATPRGLGQSTPAKISEFWIRDNSSNPVDISGIYMFWRDAWQNI